MQSTVPELLEVPVAPLELLDVCSEFGGSGGADLSGSVEVSHRGRFDTVAT